jgi:hypothetical protein
MTYKARVVLCFGLLVCCLLPLASAQQPEQKTKVPRDSPIYLYNERLDKLGQDLQKAAGDVTNGQVFQNQLKNLETLSQPALDRLFTSAWRATLAQLDAALTWERLLDFVNRAKQKLDATAPQKTEWQQRVVELKKQIGKTEAARDESQAKGSASQAVDILEAVSKADEVIAFGKFLAARDVALVTPTDLRIVQTVEDSSGRIAEILKQLAAKPLPSAEDLVSQMKTDLAKAELEHLTTLIKIEERRVAAEDDVRSILSAIEDALKCPLDPSAPAVLTRVCLNKVPLAPAEEIQITLDEMTRRAAFAIKSARDKLNDAFEKERLADAVPANAARRAAAQKALRDAHAQETAAAVEQKKLRDTVYLLENWAAFAARATTPNRLAALRTALEERRYAIRRDAIMAQTYERILANGAQRIAAYYKGGIKPATLAQLLQAAATAGLIPTIAFK